MKNAMIVLLSLCALTFALVASGSEDATTIPMDALQGPNMSLDQPADRFELLSDSDVACDADAEGEGCALAVCSCLCNAVPVTVVVNNHGETCDDVNGRPCATSDTNSGKYTSCA